jgi:hypothetical protein
METLNRFYTYAYLREDRTPYYIGKGHGNRAYKREKTEVIKLPKDKSRIIFLKQNLTEEEAFKHEVYMISLFGRKDLGTGILYNRTDGGEGGSGAIRSEETKIRISKSRKGKYVGKDNHNYGKSFSEETRKKLSEAKKDIYVGKNNPNYGKRGEESHNYGKKWWNDGKGNTQVSFECPGEEWVVGRGKNKLLWWNNGKTQKRCEKCPGEGWVPGRGKVRMKNTDTF